MTQLSEFTTMTARDLEAGWTARVTVGGRARIEEIMEVRKEIVHTYITWADGTSTVLHGNTYVQVQMG